MDITQKYKKGKSFFDASSIGDRQELKFIDLDDQDPPGSLFCFSIEEERNPNTKQMDKVMPYIEKDPLDYHHVEDTNYIDGFLEQSTKRVQEKPHIEEEAPKNHLLREAINFIIMRTSIEKEELKKQSQLRYPELKEEIIGQLVEKFKGMKKTREELVKYVMRKAFKHILDLPKNKQILQQYVQQDEKFGISKSKHRFLQTISHQKSMNNKFLKQVFSEKSFIEEYSLFVQHFTAIMEKDNQHKIQFLSEMISKNGDIGDSKRLPWTDSIMRKVAKLARDLPIKFRG